MFRVYMETSGNKPLIFGGGSPDTSASEDLSGVQFVNGTRPGNTDLVDLAKQQVGNVGGYPYWSWYGFNSRVEWCACFVSWCYNQAGVSEPKFAACQSQGVPWFQSRGQWGARGYENIAPGDAIFFDWLGLRRQRRPCRHCHRHRRQPRLYRGGQFRRRLQDKKLRPELSVYQRVRADELVNRPKNERRNFIWL